MYNCVGYHFTRNDNLPGWVRLNNWLYIHIIYTQHNGKRKLRAGAVYCICTAMLTGRFVVANWSGPIYLYSFCRHSCGCDGLACIVIVQCRERVSGVCIFNKAACGILLCKHNLYCQAYYSIYRMPSWRQFLSKIGVLFNNSENFLSQRIHLLGSPTALPWHLSLMQKVPFNIFQLANSYNVIL